MKDYLGASLAARRLRERALDAARSDRNVFIVGETGTGKELIAQSIHAMSKRPRGPMVSVACAELIAHPALEAALFGTARSRGLFEQAARGTLHLDEVSLLPPEAQDLILPALGSGRYRRRRVTFRVVATSQLEPEALVTRRGFAKELVELLSQELVYAPPLRHRRSDIPLLATALLEGAPVTSEGLRALQRLPWPGNVRQLQNVLLTLRVRQAGAPITAVEVEDQVLDDWWRRDGDLIRFVHASSGFDVEVTAALLELDEAPLRRLLKRHGLPIDGEEE